MKKFLALIAIALLVAAAVWLVVRIELSRRVASVEELLPRETLLLLHAPDLKRSRDRWHESALYQIWQEPSVQAWVKGRLGRWPSGAPGGKTLEEFLALGPTRTFLALTSIENNEPKLVGGFHFEIDPQKAEQFVQARERSWWPRSVEARREMILHGQHRIEKLEVARLQYARVYAGHWFFAANDVPTLEALLDRADRRADLATAALKENETFSSALKHLPNDYALLLFLDPQPFLEKLLPLVTLTGQSLPVGQLRRLKSVRSVATALGFDGASMRETDFIAMPRAGSEKRLARPLFSTASTETIYYSVSRMQWPDQLFSPPKTGNADLDEMFRQLSATLTGHGVRLADLRAAFGEELEMMAQWPAGANWPTCVATLPVVDGPRARKIVEAVTSQEMSGISWTRTEKEGAIFFSAQPFGGFLPLFLTVAVSDKMLLAGSDLRAVESAMAKAGRGAGGLEKSEPFREIAAKLPSADTGFSYLNSRLLFLRADAAVRPALAMAGTIYPDLGRTLDLTKLPSKDAIARHLSPIAMSQRYVGDGYLSESVGPVTLRQATIGLGITVAASFIYLRDGVKQLQEWHPPQAISAAPARPTATPVVTPSPTPGPSPP